MGDRLCGWRKWEVHERALADLEKCNAAGARQEQAIERQVNLGQHGPSSRMLLKDVLLLRAGRGGVLTVGGLQIPQARPNVHNVDA